MYDFGSVWFKLVLASWQTYINHRVFLRIMASLSLWFADVSYQSTGFLPFQVCQQTVQLNLCNNFTLNSLLLLNDIFF